MAESSTRRRLQPRVTMVTAASLLLLALGFQQSATAFSPLLPRVPTSRLSAPSSSSSSTGSQALKYISPITRLRVATEQSVDLDIETLKGEDGIYNIVDKEQHK